METQRCRFSLQNEIHIHTYIYACICMHRYHFAVKSMSLSSKSGMHENRIEKSLFLNKIEHEAKKNL